MSAVTDRMNFLRPMNDVSIDNPSGTDTPIRWGIVGTGRIAHRFAQSLVHVPHARLTSVWSRRSAPVETFVQQHGGPAAASFHALLASGIDAIYIATMQDSHAHYAIAALEAGIPVLCEK